MGYHQVNVNRSTFVLPEILNLPWGWVSDHDRGKVYKKCKQKSDVYNLLTQHHYSATWLIPRVQL